MTITTGITRSQTSTPSGHPEQLVLSTVGGAILTGSSVLINTALSYGISWSFYESDPVCGPGLYQFTRLLLPLRRSSIDQTESQSLVVHLFVNDASGVPTGTKLLSTPAMGAIPNSTAPPSVVSFFLPTGFSISSAAYPVGTSFTLDFKASQSLSWFSTSAPEIDGPPGFGFTPPGESLHTNTGTAECARSHFSYAF